MPPKKSSAASTPAELVAPANTPSCMFADNGLVGVLHVLKANDVAQLTFVPHPDHISLIGYNTSSTAAIHVSYPCVGTGLTGRVQFSCNLDTMYSKVVKIKDRWMMCFGNRTKVIRCITHSWGGQLTTDENMIEDVPVVEADLLDRVGTPVLVCHSTMLCEVLKAPLVGNVKELVYYVDIQPGELVLRTHHEYNETNRNQFTLALTAENVLQLPPVGSTISQKFKAVQVERLLGFASVFDRLGVSSAGDVGVFHFTSGSNPAMVAVVWLSGMAD